MAPPRRGGSGRIESDPLPAPPTDNSMNNSGVMMILGELRGQFREMIHTMNNLAMKVDGISDIVLKSEALPEVIKDHEKRIAALEAAENQRKGAMGLTGWVFKSPLLGWLATAAVALWGFLHKGV